MAFRTGFKRTKTLLATAAMFLGSTLLPNAHPHVFVDARMEVVINEENAFTELRHVWRFDELFSATLLIDFDNNGNNQLDEDEIKEITDTVQKSIAEYDFYTAIRKGKEVINFYEPEEIKAYMEDDRMIMLLAIEPENPVKLGDEMLRISASDTSYYVAFDFTSENIVLDGNKSACNKSVNIPDYDALYADNADTLTEAFFDNPENPGLGDEFFAWAEIKC